jgi:hypothetical protein
MNDKKLFKYLLFLLILPIGLAIFGGDRFRYPCQDPKNWDKEVCQKPLCDVTRTCPEHVFKGQRDPRLGPPNDSINNQPSQQICVPQGVNCGK